MSDPIINSHYSDIRLDTWTSTVSLPEADFINLYNRARKKVLNRMRTIRGNFLYNEWVSDFVPNQNEYSLPQYSASPYVPRMTELVNVEVKYSADWQYEVLPRIGYNTPFNIEDAKKNGYGYYLADRSVFIFPAPKNTVIGWIRLYGTYEPAPITNTSVERDILIPEDQYEILLYEIKALVYEVKKLWNERNDAINMVDKLWNTYRSNFNRDKGFVYMKEPSYNWLT